MSDFFAISYKNCPIKLCNDDKYYDSILKDESLRNNFDPGVIFGYVEKDYYEGKGTPVDTKPQGVYKTEAGTRVSDTTPMIPSADAGGDNVTGSKSRKSKKENLENLKEDDLEYLGNPNQKDVLRNNFIFIF